MNDTKLYSVKLALGYFIFASLWVLFSDKAVELLSDSLQMYTWAQAFKGQLFVIITSLLLWGMIRKNNRTLERANDIDSVTGLHSPSVFFRHLEKTLKDARSDEHDVLFLLDIDNFKSVTDKLGFDATNRLLKDISRVIDTPAPYKVLSSRVHSDGFACLVTLQHASQIEPYIAKIHRQFNQCTYRYHIDVTCCIGVALFPSDGQNAKELMSSATFALNEAKKRKNTIEYHDITLAEQVRQRQDMVCELRKAIDHNAIDIVFQPKYSLHSGQMTGVEVLSRWTHERYGPVPPDVFIALAEEHRFCRALTTLVLEKASNQLKASQLLGLAIQSVSVNISAVELNNPRDMDSIERYLQADPEFARFLCFEITETAMLDNIDQCALAVKKLKQYGVSFSIDDFGVGYTSFRIFNKLDVDEIKVDRSFIQKIEHDDRSRAITSGIIDIGKEFGINVVAEGVENRQQLEMLKRLNCEQVQGFYLGRPAPLAQLNAELESAQAAYCKKGDEDSFEQSADCIIC
ncbi:bifunctional diguanylate cyclase/phosphodiesterase [Vibrio sp. CAU 1672]|uniref:putative bifunctional diguanylate cyclase/phosphodiesterase n=1 Tax=Vibrio sp. CAU 1672 TaxID=3032594 RepID=UPI0023DB444D|nr:bifunctional diguanylate cyclase/phosphodiesterase [Vibrio sp. CAU 1672]MDF2152818.1 bifunctional diguanylate cyclase/phosphodiesterase [Vibrio sp. CAU 1672]